MSLETSLSSFDILRADISKFTLVYDWNSAIQVIETFLKTNPNNADNKRIFELLGDCYYNLAFQQNTRDQFRTEILRAKEVYDQVVDNKRCKARASFCKYWTSDNPDERREIIIKECLPIGRQQVIQLNSSSQKDDESIGAKAYAELLQCITFACSMSSDRTQLVELVKEAKLVGRNAFSRFKNSANPKIVVSITNSYTYFLNWAHGNFIDNEENNQIRDELIPITDCLVTLAEKEDREGEEEKQQQDYYIKSLAYETLGIITHYYKHDFLGASTFFEKALLQAEKTKDHYIIASQSHLLGYSLNWSSSVMDTPEQRKEYREKSLNYSLKSIDNSKVHLATYELSNSSSFFVFSSIHLSHDVAEIAEKLRYLNKAIDIGEAGLKYTVFFPTSILEESLCNALVYKAEFVPEKIERETLLKEAISYVENNVQRLGELIEKDSWNIGIGYYSSGIVKTRLSNEKTDPQAKESLLRDSSSDFKRAVDICAKWGSVSIGYASTVGRIFENYGNTLVKLFDLSHKREDCLDAIKAYDESANYYSRANLIGFIAPNTWKIARLYDSISEYTKSSNAFTKASQQYQTASANQKSLQKSFLDLSLYMQAWSEIEDARLFHSDEKYQQASTKLKEASEVLEKTESFKYLVKHYQAFSKIEEAEELSRKESNQEASTSFGVAYDIFEQARQEILNLSKNRPAEENELIEWARLSEARGKYCLARKELDEAKSLDKSGEIKQSMSKYRSASDAFKLLEQQGADEQDRTELEALSLACEAWGIMKEAEYSASPELYSKASQLFMQAKDTKVRQSFVLSCLANAAICRAFEAGMRFKETKDVQLYSQIKKQLGTASQYYEEAGFEIASDWTGATEALFDALAYLASAEGELDPQKRTQMYHLAEKHLELSARRYGDIGYDRKRQEVLKQLKKARENRELLITPMEALSQSPTVSSTPVSFTRDQAVGLERFEVANLTGNISISTGSANIGSSIKIDIDIANVGKTPALLMKLDSLAPSNGFDIDMKSNNSNNFQNFIVDGNSISLDLKGKRLEYLKSQELSLHLITKNRGNFQLKPRILFVDELGKYRSYEFEPQKVQVTSIERKLAAIMFTDMAGYTALGQRNESLSIVLVNEQRKLLRPIFKRHNGREIKTMGDAFLVEFASSLDAARCAYDIQRATREFNISLPEDKRITLRVGVHIGDVVESEDGDITGDAVNVASRIEPLAEHGGVCLTRQVYDNIQNKFDLKLESLGLKTLKNVSSPIEVFKMVMPWE